MAKRVDIMRKLREEGMSYEKIGEIYGVSRQRVHQILNTPPKDRFRESTIQKIRYVGLRNWLLERRISLNKFDEMCETSKIYGTLCYGFEPRKSTIDAILKVTGLTYEECFRVDE